MVAGELASNGGAISREQLRPALRAVPSITRGSTDPVRGDRSEKLARLRELAGDLSPLTLARERSLPVLSSLEELLPDGLQRGSTVAFRGAGSTTLAQAVMAGPTRAGSWAACVGASTMGWAAAVEAGVELERVAVIRSDEGRAPAVLAALVDAFDLVLIGPEHRPDGTEMRRLVARARERGAVLLKLADHPGRGSRVDGGGAGPGPDVELVCESSSWSGPGEGWGSLLARRVTISVQGRRGFDRPRRVDLWLPSPDR